MGSRHAQGNLCENENQHVASAGEHPRDDQQVEGDSSPHFRNVYDTDGGDQDSIARTDALTVR